ERTSRQQAEAALADARAARSSAEAREAAVLEEQARFAMLAGERSRSLVAVSEALARGRDTPALRYLLAGALRDREPIAFAGKTAFVVGLVVSDGGPIAVSAKGAVTRGSTTLFSAGSPSRAQFVSGGEWMVATDNDLSLARWDISTGKRRWQLPRVGSATSESDIEIAHDGTFIVFANPEGRTALMLDPGTGATRGKLSVPSGEASAIAISPDAETLAVAGADGHVIVFAARSLREVQRWRAPAGVTALSYIGTSRLAAASGSTVLVWNLDAATAPAVELVHESAVDKLSAASQRELLVTSSERGVVRVWSASGVLEATNRSLRREKLASLSVAPDETAVVATTGNAAIVWYLPGLETAQTLPGYYFDVAWSADSRQLALDDPQNSTVGMAQTPRRRMRALAVAPRAVLAGPNVLAVGMDSTTLKTLAGVDVGEVARLAEGKIMTSDDGKRMLVSSTKQDDHTTLLVEPTTGAEIARFEAGGDVALSPSGKRVALTDALGMPPRLRIVDAVTGKVLVERLYEEKGEPMSVAFLDDTSLLVGRLEMGWEVWDPSTLAGRVLATDGWNQANGVHVTRNGRLVLFERAELRVTLHDSAQGALLATFTPSDDTKYVRSSGSGDVIALQAEDGTVEVFAVGRANRPDTVVRFVEPTCFALSVDGARLFTGHADGSVHVWDAATGRELDTFRAHARRVSRLELSTDDSTLLVDAADSFVSLWDVTLDRQDVATIANLAALSGWTFVDGVIQAAN
ncbi:MAG: WD40 repeat domain-containing protein, partial [Kofleriaceae bacterium]